VAVVFWAVHSWQYGTDFLSLGGALMLLAGLYFLFSLFGWVGMGDGILGVGLAFLVGKWELAFLTLFLANLLGCFMLIPMMATKRLHRHARIPFGPFLILATVIVVLWGSWIIETFLQISSMSLMSVML
jgi:leader peptidase (prepilin peptidase)/N-methyltransferase